MGIFKNPRHYLNMDKIKNFWASWQARRDLHKAENLKLKQLEEKTDQIIKLLTPETTESIIKQNMENFDFSPLWDDEPQSDLIKYLPIICAILEFIILMVLIFKK